MKKLSLKQKAFNEGKNLSRDEMKKVLGGVELYWCYCDGDRSVTSIETSAQASIDWANANCVNTFVCNNIG